MTKAIELFLNNFFTFEMIYENHYNEFFDLNFVFLHGFQY